MRKLFLLFGITLFLLSCEGPQGPQGEPGSLNTNIEYYDIYPADWERQYNSENPNEVYYRCVITPKIYQNNRNTWWDIYDYGSVHATLFSNYDTDYETQTPLPYVLNYKDQQGNITVETYYFDYDESSIAFYVSLSGGPNLVFSPGVMVFRVVMNWW